LQVHYAIEADIDVFASCSKFSASSESVCSAPYAQNSISAGQHIENEEPPEPLPCNEFRLGLMANQATCRYPMLLRGVKCYSDASTLPDMLVSDPRKAGLGIFVIDPRNQARFFIKAKISNITSVLMVEAAGLALAASIISLLQTNDISFLTDNQQLVNFFNGQDLNSPPLWEIKPFTQRFLNEVSNQNIQVLKIARGFNATAHTLATQAFRHLDDQCNLPCITCTNESHGSSCPLHAALQSVTWDSFSLIAASCC